MQLQKICAAASVSIFLLSALGQAQTTTNALKVEYSSSSDYVIGQKTMATQNRLVTRYYVPDGTVRTETIDPVHGKKNITIANEKQGYEIFIDESARIARKTNGIFHAAKSGSAGTTGDTIELGKSNIQGYSCNGYQNTFPDHTILKHWFCTEPRTGISFLARIESTRNGSTTVESVQQVMPGTQVPNSFFQIPQGYKIETTNLTSSASTR